jgi:hypothetical protein
MHLNKVNTPHASSTGCLQVDQSIHPSKQKRSMNDLVSVFKNNEVRVLQTWKKICWDKTNFFAKLAVG